MTSLINFLDLTPAELVEFLALQKAALEDKEHHGVPESLRKFKGFGDIRSPISGYEVLEIEKPLRFKQICGWSLA